MSKVFVIAETEGAARELCAGARTLAEEVVLCCVGVPAITGIADTCIHIDVPAGNVPDDAYSSVCEAFDAAAAKIVLVEQTVRMLSLAGRLAAHAEAAVITGVSSLEGGIASSLYFAGAGVREAKPVSEVAMYAINRGVFDGSEAKGSNAVEEVAFVAPPRAIAKVASEAIPPSDVDLNGADIVVGCGRGFSSEDELQRARDLANKVHGEVGCTRPLAEGLDWFPKEAYIGISGAMIAPKAYIAVGVSGQMQHTVGVSDAHTIIAVNKDRNAPIFRQCDLGFVGDLSVALPALVEAL